MPLAAGTRLGPYEVLGLIGAGGMGEVYKARDTRLDRTVAIKVLPAHVSSDPERRARFEREAKTIAELNHPRICALYDIGREGDTDFLVMEYVEGTRLTSPHPVAKALAYAIQIADALCASHQKGIIHRDLKPANVMVTPEGQVKVLDFGLAKHLAARPAGDSDAATATTPSNEPSLTGKGVAVGTVSYMSPEQVEGKPLDARSDVFSFGALLYELLTGQRAFQGDSAISTMSAILRGTPVRASKVRPDVPHRLEAILNRCLEKDRDLRTSVGGRHELSPDTGSPESGMVSLPETVFRVDLAGFEYAGKSLPTLYHWYQATGIETNSAIVSLSNFVGKGAAAVGAYPGVSSRGVYDLAGNHREWTWTETRGRHYRLGGAWNEPSYFLMASEARPPFDRAPENGFRCVKYQDGKIPPARYAGPLDKQSRDYSRERPASDETFRIFGSFYPRDTGPLEARVESEDASPENWRKLKVSYAAGYGGERLPAYLFLPNTAVPPYQAVVWFPGATALQVRNSDALVNTAWFDFIIQSGRAVLYPIYKGTYERDAGLTVGHQSRESVTWWLSEVRRSVDYLESRPDIDAGRIAYAGLSWGARLASILLAMEPRLRAAVLFAGGYNLVSRSPEIDDFN